MPDDSAVRFSVLDLAPICAGSDASQAFRNSLDLARHVEQWGYHRFWLAEHHNIAGIASAATSILIAHIAAGTSRIRVGSGGIMLPNHSPLVIAEQFGTLESLFPGRIDLGIGRAPGGDMLTAAALRRDAVRSAENFPQDLQELRGYFGPAGTKQRVRAIPGAGLDVPIYLLGSSNFSATLAAQLGLPFAFASHFAPDYLHSALELYRARFEPSKTLDRPYVMVGVNAIAADTDENASRMLTSLQQQFLNVIRGAPSELPPPVQSMEGRWTAPEQAHVNHMIRYSAVGSPTTIQRRFEEFLAETQANELILTSQIYDHAARLRSFQLSAEVLQRLAATASGAAS